MPCDDHGGFTYEATDRFFTTELDRFNPSEEIQMVPFHAMAALSRVRTMISFGKEPAAVDVATTELKRPGNVEMHEMLRAELGSIFRKAILELLAVDKKYEALTFYKEKASYLPKTPGSPEETDYLLKLSQAASDLGLEVSPRKLLMPMRKPIRHAVSPATAPRISSRVSRRANSISRRRRRSGWPKA